MTECHIFSGLMSSIIRPWQKGTKQIEFMIDELPSEADAHHHVWNNWPNVARRILRKHKDGRLGDGPVILIGHSNGVLAACNIAKALAAFGIKVQYIGAIDPTLASFEAISHNVEAVDEFWASRGFVARRRQTSKTARRWFGSFGGEPKGVCHFVDRWRGDHEIHRIENIGHIAISRDAEVRNRIVRAVSDIVL